MYIYMIYDIDNIELSIYGASIWDHPTAIATPFFQTSLAKPSLQEITHKNYKKCPLDCEIPMDIIWLIYVIDIHRL